MGQLDVAERLCKEVLGKHPKNMGGRFLRARLLGKRGELGRAERELFVLATEFPESARVQYHHALAALAVGKTGMALQAMQAAKRIKVDMGSPLRASAMPLGVPWPNIARITKARL